MQSLFDNDTRAALIQRINSLTAESTAQWGKMNVYQMIQHCIVCEEMFLGKKKYKQAFMGRIFGKMALHNFLKDEKPLNRNSPTGKDFKIAISTGDLAAAKAKWIALVDEFANYSNPAFAHWFFGKMTREQVGQFDYKHIDHHLRQFSA